MGASGLEDVFDGRLQVIALDGELIDVEALEEAVVEQPSGMVVGLSVERFDVVDQPHPVFEVSRTNGQGLPALGDFDLDTSTILA